ncbi:hypothetical protein L9F63_011826, partial [Diploptera punctata]
CMIRNWSRYNINFYLASYGVLYNLNRQKVMLMKEKEIIFSGISINFTVSPHVSITYNYTRPTLRE